MPNSESFSLIGQTLSLGSCNLSLYISKKIGQGSFGTVYQAIDLNTHRKYAVKHVDNQKSTEQQKLADQTEAHIHAMLSSSKLYPDFPRRIVKLYDAVSAEKIPGWLVVMEFCDQPDLFDFLVQGKLDAYPDKNMVVREIFAQICDAIYFCHLHGVYHRDIKPENIMLKTERGGFLSVRLADFGLAVDSNTTARVGCGSPTYMSPESQLSSDFSYPYSPEASDIWALGMLACNLFSGTSPWENARYSDPGFKAFLQKGWVALKHILGVDEATARFLATVLDLDPKKRPSVLHVREMALNLKTPFAHPKCDALPQLVDVSSPLIDECATPMMQNMDFIDDADFQLYMEKGDSGSWKQGALFDEANSQSADDFSWIAGT